MINQFKLIFFGMSFLCFYLNNANAQNIIPIANWEGSYIDPSLIETSGYDYFSGRLSNSNIKAQVCKKWKINEKEINKLTSQNNLTKDSSNIVGCAETEEKSYSGSIDADKKCNTGGRVVRSGDPECGQHNSEFTESYTKLNDTDCCCIGYKLFTNIGWYGKGQDCSHGAFKVEYKPYDSHPFSMWWNGNGNSNMSGFVQRVEPANSSSRVSVGSYTWGKQFNARGDSFYIYTTSGNIVAGICIGGVRVQCRKYRWNRTFDTNWSYTNIRGYNYSFSRPNSWKIKHSISTVYDPNMLKN